MSQRSNQKRKARLKKKGKPTHVRSANAKTHPDAEEILAPSAQTLMRAMQINFDMQESILRMAGSTGAMLLERDGDIIRQIELAPDLNAVLDLTPNALGLGEVAWFKRLRQFGPDAAPVIAQWLRTGITAHPNVDYDGEQEKCIAALGWCGAAGMEALLQRWDDFNDYGRSLACVALGLLGARGAADKMWDFYQRTKDNADENLFIGALWALIDLEDPRAADALHELLMRGEGFYEFFGFMARAGDRRSLSPLMSLAEHASLRSDVIMAAVCIAHRIGRDALIAVLQDSFAADESGQQAGIVAADQLLAQPQDRAKDYFSIFYKEPLTLAADAAA